MTLPILLVVFATFGVAAAPAAAAPVLNLDLHHSETNFAPGSPGSIEVDTLTDGAAPSTDEIQELRIMATAGQYKLSFGGHTTGDLPVDATAGQVQSALRALPSIGSPNVTVAGGPSGGGPGGNAGNNPHVITFSGALAATNVNQIEATAGTAPLRLPAEIWPDIVNVGDAETTGPITLNLVLPSGMTLESARTTKWGLDSYTGDEFDWDCTGVANVTCTSNAGAYIPRHFPYRGLRFAVNVAQGLSGDRFVQARVSGGGAAPAPGAAGCAPGAAACAIERIPIDSALADFGIIPDTYVSDFFDADGVTPVRQSGAHPDLFTTTFDFASNRAGVVSEPRLKLPEGNIRNIRVNLPPGFLGDPSAVPECSQAQFVADLCPPSTQVGRFDARLNLGLGFAHESQVHGGIAWAVYNLTRSRGAIADLAFAVNGQPIHILASLDPTNNYTVTASVPDINPVFPVFDQKLTLWGVPADPSHDSERCPGFNGFIGGGFSNGGDTTQACPAGVPRRPFLTVPFQCDTDLSMRLYDYDSWQSPGVFGPDLTYDLPGQFTGCDQSQAEFDPSATITPTSPKADSPTGLNVTAEVPFNDDPDGLATPPVRRLEVTLPEGMAVNPAFADGLRGCTEDEIGITHAGVPDLEPVTCPDASRIGSVELSTPLLPDAPDPATDLRCPDGGVPLHGSIYLAEQTDNPLNELFAIYTVVHDCEDRGVLVKLPGSMVLDPDTGQITTVFDELPQFPFDSLSVKFRAGDRAPLINPPTCGTHEIEGVLNTYTEPTTDVPIGNTYEVTQAADGGPCDAGTPGQPADPADRADLPFAPVMTAGTVTPAAGQYSPFVLKLTRQDGEQEITSIAADLPPGLVGKLAGVAQCSDATLAAIPEDPGTGQAEIDNPSCPANSKVGHTNAGSGAGSEPFYIRGEVYLAGPFDPDGAGPLGTAPISVAAVTPAVTGGLDLGNVVIRTALYIDQDDAQLHAVSEPIPTILHGVPIHLRDVRVVMNRDNFTLNPTSCDPMQTTGAIGGAGEALVDPSDDTAAPVSAPFRVGGCGALDLGPKMTTTLLNGRQGIGRSAHPNLLFNLNYRYGDANLRRVEVLLPKAFQIDQSNLGNICSETQLAANECAGRQRVGTATATTPLLDAPLTGLVYAVSGSGGLPKLAVILHGPPELPVKLVVRGTTDTVGARIRNTFPLVPDAPVSSFQLNIDGGPQGYLVNNQNLCTRVKGKGKRKRIVRNRAATSDITYFAHNGDTLRQKSTVLAKCPKLNKKAKRGKGRKAKQSAPRPAGRR